MLSICKKYQIKQSSVANGLMLGSLVNRNDQI